MSPFNRRIRYGLTALCLLALAVGLWPASRWWRSQLRRATFAAVVVVSFDTLNVRFTGPYNPKVEYTPVLDGFAARGVRFEHAYTTIPITLPSHATLFSGRSPESIGVMANGDVVPLDVETLAEILQRHGYATGAFPSLGVLEPKFGLDQGFDLYDDWMADNPSYRPYRRADEVISSALEWIRAVRPSPFFAWIHLSDPHEPYRLRQPEPDVELWLDETSLGRFELAGKRRFRVDAELPPGPHRLEWRSLRQPSAEDLARTRLELRRLDLVVPVPGVAPAIELGDGVAIKPSWSLGLDNRGTEPVRFEVAFAGALAHPPRSEVLEKYREEVSLADEQLGRLRAELDAIGLGGRMLWLLVSDHGEGLYHHQILGHSAATFEEQLKVAWMLSGPEVPAGEVVDTGPVLLADVLPTLLDVLGLPLPDALDGRSQRGCFSGGECRPWRRWRAFGLLHDSGGRPNSVARYLWPYKGIWHQQRRSGVFDLERDPLEMRRLPREQIPNEEVRGLARSAAVERESLRAQLAERAGRRALSDADEETLRSLGYL